MPGLEDVDQYPGHLEAQISLHLIFSFGFELIYKGNAPRPCRQFLCALIGIVPSSPEALRTMRHDWPLLAKEGN
jgi:hypothetical protein